MVNLKQFVLPSGVRLALSALEDAGFEAYAVGGAVRDLFRGVTPSDFDITTKALPEQVKAVFKGFKVYETGIKHGTVTVVSDGVPLEITTFRLESTYSDGRHPDGVRFADGVAEDLSRRDFTVNAIAFSPSRGVIDPFGGEADIKNRVIRAVGVPRERFEEDGLRVIRALRFSAVLGFEIEAVTAQALVLCKEMLLRVSAERVSAEFGKLLCGEKALEVLERFLPVVSTVYPQLQGLRAVSLQRVEKALEQRLAALFFDLGEEKARSLSKVLKFSRDSLENALSLAVEAKSNLRNEKAFVKREMRRLGAERLKKCLDFRRRVTCEPLVEEVELTLGEILKSGECYDLKGLKLKGEELIDAGAVRGPAVGEALELLLSAVINGEVENRKESLLRYFFDSVTNNKRDSV